jgi:hypothetical protein
MINRIFFVFILHIIILFTSCKYNDEEIGKIDNYKLVENRIDRSCTIYQLVFNKGEYICRYSLSGSCDNLSIQNYIFVYERYLINNKKKLNNIKGFIIFDHYFNGKKEKALIDSLIYITKLNLDHKVLVKDIDKNSFIIAITPNWRKH